MVKQGQRRRLVAVSSPPNTGAAAPAADSTGGKAKAAYLQYVKGKRREGLEILEKAHAESPSAATCLVGAKLFVLDAAEAAFKDDVSDDVREAAVLRHLHRAMDFAACGAVEHLSISCLQLLCLLLFCTEGRPGWAERKPLCERVRTALIAGGGLDAPGNALAARPWLAFGSEAEGLERWQFEDNLSDRSQQEIVREVCGKAREKVDTCLMLDTVAGWAGGDGVPIIVNMDSEHRMSPADVRMTEVYLLPDKLDSHLRRRRAHKRHVAAQGRQQAGQEPAAHSAPSTAHLPEQVLKRRRQELPGLKARAAKIRDFLLSRAAAAGVEGGAGGAAAPRSLQRGSDEGVCPGSQLAALLAQTELGEQELKAQLEQQREHTSAAQRQAALAGLRRARGGQALSCALPALLVDVLTRLLPPAKTAPLLAEQQRNCDAGAPAAAQAQRLAQQLHELAWEAEGPRLGDAQLPAVLRSSSILRDIHKAGLMPRGRTAQRNVAISLPDLASLEVLPECPGDLELLGQGGAATGGPLPMVLGMLHGLQPGEAGGAGSAHGAGDRPAGTSPQTVRSIDSDEEFWPGGSGGLASGERSPGGDAEAPGASSPGQRSGQQLAARNRPLAVLETSLRRHAMSGWVLEALLDLGPLEFSHLRLASLDGRSMRQLSCSRLLCALLLGLELLELLDRQEEAQQAEQAAAGQPRAAEADEAPGAAGAAEAPGAAGQTGGAPSDALVARLARLTVAGWASKDLIDPMALADALAESGPQAEGLKLALAGAIRTELPAAAGFLVLGGLLFDEVEEHAGMMRALRQDSTPIARHYVLQARRRLCRRILLGLQAMQQARCLTPSLLATLRNFLLLATSAADAGNDDGSDSGSKGGGPGGADAGAAGLGSEPHDGVSLEGLGRLPLQHLMELCAFLATLLGCEFSTPAALVPELHAAMLNCRMPAEVTPTGGVRLTADGLQALGTEVEAMEAFRQSREAPKAACRTLVEHALAAPEAGACCGDVKAAADLLAAYSCGVPHAEAEVARRVMAAGVDAHLQSLHAAPALMLLRGMQRLACVHTLLAGLAGSAARALQETYSLVEQLEGVLGPLGQVTALRGPPEPALRAHLAGRLFALRDSLDSQLEEHNTIAQAAWETQLGLRRELKQYEERLLRQEEQRAAAQAELLAPASPERRKLAKRQKELALALAAVSQELQLSGFEEFSNPGLTARDRDVVRRAMQLSGVLARELKAADDAEGSAARQVQGGLLDALRSLRDILAMQASSLDADLRSLQAVADCAAVHVETCAGQLVYAHCLRPSLEPACRALTRHLLGAKWGAELQARQVAEEEARRQAALQALLEEEEEQGGSAAAQAKGEQKRAKKKAKKAAKKEGAAASGQAEPQQQAGPKHAELMQDSRQHEQEAGLQRLLQQMEQEQEEQLRKQREQQQQEREQEEQERQQREEQQQEREQEEQQRQQREEQQQQRQREQEEQEQRREQELPEQQVQQHKLQKLHKLHKQGQEQQQPPLEGQANAAATTDALLGGEEAEQQQQQQQEAAQPKQDSRASTANAQNGRKRVGQPAAMQPAGAAAQAGAAGGQQLQAPASADLLAEQERHEQPSQLPGHKIAAAAPEHYQEEEEEGVWQQAASSSRRGGRAGKRASGPPAPPPQPRPAAIVSWEGHWRCACGSTVPPRTNCRDCGERNPCREYVFGGGCSRGGPPSCMFPHPPFDLPPGARPPAGRSLVAPPAGLALHGCVLPPSVARPGARAAAAAKPGQPTSPEAKVPSPRTARGAATVAPRHAGSRAWQPSGPAPPSLAAVTEGPPAPATPATGPLGSSASGRAWPQDQAAAPHEAPRGSADTAVPAGRDDADLASLLGMMGLDSEDQEAAAAAALGEAASSTTRGLLPVPAAASSWAQRAVARISAEPADAIPTAAAEAAAWPAPGQSQEDAELEAAIQASLAEAAAAAGSALQPDRGSPAAAAAVPSENGLGLAGLRNDAGEYNCFLNVIVQCLWRCTAFRRQVAGWDSAFCISEPVVQCLHTLFHQFQRQERELQSEAAQGGAPPPVDPTPLRRALAALPGQHFRVGEMNDAAEVLLAIYERVIEAAAGLGRSAGIEPTFGLSVREEVHCPRCGKTTHQSEYTQYFYNTQATVLHMLSDACGSSLSTGQLLREAEAQHQKSCDEDVGGCGRPCPVNHFLQHAPRVFTLQLAWESQSEQPADIAGTLAAIDEEVDLGEVYQGAERGAHRYRLRSMVCYYGQHYQALVLVPEAGGWLVFDDTRVARVGSWEAVRHKCEAGRIQPSVLFYEATS